MIEVSNLRFEYPGTLALDDVSIQVDQSSITALVGPNGAGKTTLLRCLAALEMPILGRIRIDGVDVLTDPRSCHRRVGYLSDFFGLYEDLTVGQCLKYMAMAHEIPLHRQVEVVEKAAARLKIEDRLDMKASTLSRGLRQRLAIAQAIIHGPKVLLLDEPASGLDPEARHSLAGLFLELRKLGMTLIVSSHILSELEEYSTDMLVIRGGKIVEHQSISSLASSGVFLRITLTGAVEELKKQLESLEGTSDVTLINDGAVFCFSSDGKKQHELLKAMLQKGIPLKAFSEDKEDMQQTYLKTIRSEGI